MPHQDLIQTLLENPKILSISILYTSDSTPYVCVQYQGKLKSTYDILISPEDLPWLLHPFTVSSINGSPYVRLMLPNGYKYLHQMLDDEDIPAGSVVHHTRFTCDNRRESLQIVPREAHSRFHRYQKIQQTRKDRI